MDASRVLTWADEYLEQHWEDILVDIETLVAIPSFKEDDKAAEGSPWGPGPRAGLTAGLELAQRLGMESHDLSGYIGYADLPGKSKTLLGMIGHMDVVPAGPGWNFEPYALARKDGYLLGRGVIDDKGPSVVALHALNAVRLHTRELFGSDELPYTVRFIFGADEESGMGDVPYYLQQQPAPAFLFTPDAEFPVCYGEKGLFGAIATSKPLGEDAHIVSFEGGTAPNAVPGLASCTVRADAAQLPQALHIRIEEAGEGLACIHAQGKAAHASMPEGGVNAIGLIVDHLVGHVELNEEETAFVDFMRKVVSATDGSGVGCAVRDSDFGALTMVGSVIEMKDGCLSLSIDARYPTGITAGEITARLAGALGNAGSVETVSEHEPFLVEADTPAIQTLLKAYCEVTGEDAQAFTMGGGTYAREFPCAASFGPEFLDEEKPEWVGGMHGPDEGTSEESLKQAFRIYAVALASLMELEF